MRSRIGVTAVAAALSVLLSSAGHVVAAGHQVPVSALPQLLALGAASFLLATSGLGLHVLIPALAAIQTGLHLGLDALDPAPVVQQHAGHLHHTESLPAATTTSGLPPMLGMHLGALLISVLLLHRAHQWWTRIAGAVARVIPVLPEMPRRQFGVPAPIHAEDRPAPVPRRWLPADLRRRGPPATGVFRVLS